MRIFFRCSNLGELYSVVFTGKESSYPFTIEDLLKHTAEVGGSDLHLVAGIEPCVRINGDLKRQNNFPKLEPEDIEKMLLAIMSPLQKTKLEEDWELDLAVAVPGVARFRGNVIILTDGEKEFVSQSSHSIECDKDGYGHNDVVSLTKMNDKVVISVI